jgi:hypothetical protein
MRGEIAGLTENDIVHIETSVAPPGISAVQAAVDGLDRRVVIRLRDSTVLDTVAAPIATRAQSKLEFARIAPTGPMAQLSPISGDSMSANIPFVPLFHTAYSPMGYWVSGDPHRYAVTVGRLDGPVRLESDLAAVESTVREREELVQYAKWSYSAVARPLPLNVSMIPHSKPFFKGISVDWDGLVWVELHQDAVRLPLDTVGRPDLGRLRRSRLVQQELAPSHIWEEPTVYDLFAPDGEFVGRLRLPPRSTVIGSRNRRIWLLQRNEMDVVSLARYSVIPAEGAPSETYWRR